MESKWKVIVFCGIFIQIWITIQAATTSIDLFSTRSLNNDNLLPPLISPSNADKSFQSYTTKTTRSFDDFNPRPQIKTTKFPSPSNLFTSYVPPPSGLVSYKNIQLPFKSSVKLPILLPNSINTNDFTKHPGFFVPPPPPSALSEDEIDIENSEPMYMIEEPASVLLQPKHNRTIEAAKILASTLLEASGEASLESEQSKSIEKPNSTDVYIVKSQKKAYIIPTYLKKEVSKPSAIEKLYPLRDQFDKAYTINQFIFVIKPEKINFLNKLV